MKGQTDQNNEPKELVIEESGYYLSSDTSPYVMYGVKLTNPNENYYVKFPVISVTSYDDKGNILGTMRTDIIYNLLPEKPLNLLLKLIVIKLLQLM